MALIAELKRRRVFRVSAAYIVVCWIILQVADIVFPAVSLPDWSMRLLLIALVVFFPVVVLVAWVFQKSSENKLQRDTHRTTPGVLIGVAVVTFAVGAALGVLWSTINVEDGFELDDSRPRVAVLPLDDLSPDSDKTYFSDGIHEELIARLAGIGGISVPPRTSVRNYRNTIKSSQQIAQELGVGYLVLGSVRHSSDRVMISIQLVDAAADRYLWVQDFDRVLTVENLFDIQQNVAKNVAKLLEKQLMPNELQRLAEIPTRSLAAYDAALKGIFHYRRYGADGLRLAIEYFDEATRLDPTYAFAWSGLANSYLMAATSYGWMDAHDAAKSAKKFGARALELDRNNASVLSLIGDIAYWYDFDPVAAEKMYLEGIAVDPRHVGNRLSYAYLLSTQGRHDEARAQITYCISEEPRSAHVYANSAWRNIDSRRYELALEHAEIALQIDPSLVDVQYSRGFALIYLGRIDEAKKIPELDGHPVIQALLLGRTGQIDAARRHADAQSERGLRSGDIAMTYAIAGDVDEAFHWVDQAIDDRHREILLLGSWELFDPLRSDPRYQAALDRIGFNAF